MRLELCLASLVLACGAGPSQRITTPSPSEQPAAVPTPAPGQEVAVLAGGCFWCLEADLDKLDGVVATTSGYAGGKVDRPEYHAVGTGSTGHAEVVHVVFDPAKLPYAKLLDYFWHHVDPTDAGGQFCDRGNQYRTGVFPQNEAQLQAATESKAALQGSGKLRAPVVTEIVPGQVFWAAEQYHQDFHVTNPARYQSYRLGCGRDRRVAEVWAGAH